MTTANSVVEYLDARSLGRLSWAELAASILRQRGVELPPNDDDMLRAAFASVEGVSTLTGIANAAILTGFRGAADSLAGVYREVPLPDYTLSELAALSVFPRLERLSRGQVAPAAAWGVSGTGFRLAKFGVQFVLDEQDFQDFARLAVFQTALGEVGAAVRRLVGDLLYSVLLSNPTLGDGVALFDSSRGNLATGAGSTLGATSLDTAMTAIAGQVGADTDGAPVHLGLVPRYLIVAPGDLVGGRTLARTIALGDGSDLVVRTESRMGTAGVLNPLGGELVAGNGTNWLLAAPANQVAGLVLGLLNGQAEPRVRHFELDRGSWGIGFDISFSCGAAAVDGKPLYWSVGQ